MLLAVVAMGLAPSTTFMPHDHERYAGDVPLNEGSGNFQVSFEPLTDGGAKFG